MNAPLLGAWLGDLTWPEAAERIAAGTVVVVPIGAAAKAHGPHLPLDTDRCLARALAEGVARELPVLLAPIVDGGFYPAFAGYPGRQTLPAETFVALVTEVLAKLAGDGARRLAVINPGVSTEAPLALAARAVLERTGVQVHAADIRNLGHAADHVLDNPEGGHADEHETSLMLAIDAGRVRMERAVAEPGGRAPRTVFRAPVVLRDDPAEGPGHSRTGATGDPTRASAEKGAAILEAMVRDLVDGLRAIFPDAPGMG
jgi:creatinine amidohydrolase